MNIDYMRKFYGGRRKYNGLRSRGPTRYIAKKALRTARVVKSLVHPETFYLDTSAQNRTINYSGDVQLLTAIAQGNDINNRSGNSVFVKSLYVRGFMQGNSQNGSEGMRVMVVQDVEGTGTAPTLADVLQSTGSNLSLVSALNVDHTPRYRVLYDKLYSLRWQQVGSATDAIPFKIYKKLNIPVKFTGSATTDTYKNAIYMMCVSAVNTNDPIMTYYTRIGYLDN